MMNIVIMGYKGSGKSTIGLELANLLNIGVVDTDDKIEKIHEEWTGKRFTCRDLYKNYGESNFRTLEHEVVERISGCDYHIIITGGGLMMQPDARRSLRAGNILVYLYATQDALWSRVTQNGLPPWLEDGDGQKKFLEQTELWEEVLRPFADIVLDTSEGSPKELAAILAEKIGEELSVRQIASNTFGSIIRMTAFGESHGPAIGVVLDGIRPGVEIAEEDIQRELDRRRPGQSKVVTQRKEGDKIHILSGVYEGRTTGAPIAMIIYNEDQRSKNYDDLKMLFRPGHGDFTFYRKYGHRDHRGGGRQSGRETACRVAAGALAKVILGRMGVRIVAHAIEVAGIRAKKRDLDTIESNPVRCADSDVAPAIEQAILDARKHHDSVGGIIQLEIYGLPPGLGDPIFGKLDARLTSAIMTMGAVKGVEIGDGFGIVCLNGSTANDGMRDGKFLSNHHGGILGGISTGEPVIMRVAVKPTASIATKQATCDINGENVEVEVLGRHDPCIVPRAVPVVENMAALVLCDALEIQSRLNPEWAARYYPREAE